MTSNVGARKLKDFGNGVGFGTAAQKQQESSNAKSVIENALKKAFAPEFLNRIDDVVVFNNLEKEDINKIIDIELEKLLDRISELGYRLKLTNKAKKFISEKGFDKQYGARPLKRAIQKYVEDVIAEEIIKSNVQLGDVISIDLKKGDTSLNIKISTNKNKPKEES
jgi:ATP-dependent Clp protease ATP-binding subunit ClpC